MTATSVYVYGAGGHGKVALHALLAQGDEVLGFVDDNLTGVFCKLPVLAPRELQNVRSFEIHFAIGHNLTRQRLQTEWFYRNIGARTAVHPESFVYPDARIGGGSLIAPRATVGPDAWLGEGCIVNHNAVVDHDCVVGAFCHIAPGAILGGAVRLGEGCIVGAGAVVLPRLSVGRNVTIGAGAIVTKDLPDGETVVGMPAKPIPRAKPC